MVIRLVSQRDQEELRWDRSGFRVGWARAGRGMRRERAGWRRDLRHERRLQLFLLQFHPVDLRTTLAVVLLVFAGSAPLFTDRATTLTLTHQADERVTDYPCRLAKQAA